MGKWQHSSLREDFQRICGAPHRVTYAIKGPPVRVEVRQLNMRNEIETVGFLSVEQLELPRVRITGEQLGRQGAYLAEQVVRELRELAWEVEFFPDGIEGAIDQEKYGFATRDEATEFLNGFSECSSDRKTWAYALRVAEIKTSPERGGDPVDRKRVQQARKILGL